MAQAHFLKWTTLALQLFRRVFCQTMWVLRGDAILVIRNLMMSFPLCHALFCYCNQHILVIIILIFAYQFQVHFYATTGIPIQNRLSRPNNLDLLQQIRGFSRRRRRSMRLSTLCVLTWKKCLNGMPSWPSLMIVQVDSFHCYCFMLLLIIAFGSILLHNQIFHISVYEVAVSCIAVNICQVELRTLLGLFLICLPIYYKSCPMFTLPDALQAGASQFEASAGKLKNKYWWKNMKV